MLWGRSAALAVPVAFAVDLSFGEPPARWHPVVWIGRALSATGAPWPSAAPSAAFMRGAAAWLIGAATSTMLAAAACHAISYAAVPALGAWAFLPQGAMLGILLKPLLSWRLLRNEVAAVERALSTGLEAGREQLRSLVSRDVTVLSATEVRESALESLAENLNDSLVAPLFWFVLCGLPGAALYRFANTADAMWGYRERWEWAGKWSARADDVLSYVPARLTALLLAIAAGSWPRGVLREARATPSPNGGWPMGMLALVLDVRLSKRNRYVLHAAGRQVQPRDLHKGLGIAARAAWWCVALAAAAPLLIHPHP